VNDYRRIPCEEKLEEVGNNASWDDVFNVITTPPNWNVHHGFTLDSIVLSAEASYMNSTLWLWEVPTPSS